MYRFMAGTNSLGSRTSATDGHILDECIQDGMLLILNNILAA